MSSKGTAAAAPRRGLLFIVSAPSGTGKTTLVERLVHEVPNLRMSRSYTSRVARHGDAELRLQPHDPPHRHGRDPNDWGRDVSDQVDYRQQ